MADEEARLASLIRAAEAAPTDLGLRERTITALMAAGKKMRARKLAETAKGGKEARQRLKAVAAGRAEAPPGLRSHAGRALMQGDPRALSALLQAYPGDAGLLVMASAYHFQRSDLALSARFSRAALELDPDNADAAANLGLALTRQGQIGEALRVMTPFQDRATATPALLTNLASALLRADRPSEALAIAEPLQEDDDAAGVAASALIALDRTSEALSIAEGRPALADVAAEATERTKGREAALAFVRALDDIPDETRFRLAETLGTWGETQAGADLVHPLTTDPRNPEAARLYGLFTKWSADDPAFAAMEKGLADATLPTAIRSTYGYAFAKARRDTGQPEAAFDALDTANALRAQSAPDGHARQFETVATAARKWTPEAIVRLSEHGDTTVAPIFIVGLPRTGSTLLETLLSRHPAIHVLGETPRTFALAAANRASVTAEAVANLAADAEALRPPPNAQRTTDKLLANIEHAGLLAAAFPRAHFVEARRDWRASGLSIFEADLSPFDHPYACDLAALADRIAATERLSQHWRQAIGDRFLQVSYEDLVSDPEATLRALLDNLGLSWDPACLDTSPSERRINTMSVAQAREGVHVRSVARWQQVEHRLAPLIERLQKAGLIPDGKA